MITQDVVDRVDARAVVGKVDVRHDKVGDFGAGQFNGGIAGPRNAGDLVAQPIKLLGQSPADAAGDSGDDDRPGQAFGRLRVDRPQLDVADF